MGCRALRMALQSAARLKEKKEISKDFPLKSVLPFFPKAEQFLLAA